MIDQVKLKINSFDNETVIIGADYNLILDAEKDCQNYVRINNPNARETVFDMCVELSLCDVWREFNQDKKQFTWKKTNPLKQARLDFFLISEFLLTETSNACIESGYRTDHSAIMLKLNFEKQTRGRSFWKFNNSLLKDKEYVDTIKKT